MSSHLYVKTLFGILTTHGAIVAAGLEVFDDTAAEQGISVGRIINSDSKPTYYLAVEASKQAVVGNYGDDLRIGRSMVSFDELKKGDEATMRETIRAFCEKQRHPFIDPQWFLAWEWI